MLTNLRKKFEKLLRTRSSTMAGKTASEEGNERAWRAYRALLLVTEQLVANALAGVPILSPDELEAHVAAKEKEKQAAAQQAPKQGSAADTDAAFEGVDEELLALDPDEAEKARLAKMVASDDWKS